MKRIDLQSIGTARSRQASEKRVWFPPATLLRTGLLLALILLAPGFHPARASTLPAGFSETTINGPAGANWNECVGMTFEDNGRMYVWERGGKVWIKEYGASTWSLLIDISEEVGGWRDFGMLGFALDPNFRVNGYLYLMYVVDRHHLMNYGTPNYNPSSNEYFAATIGRITRYTARSSDGFKSVDYTSRRVLLGETKSTGFSILYESHGVGSLVFGTDGTLLASCGDGASYSSDDIGSAPETYYAQALSDGIIKPKENVGAYRSQLVDSLSGKIVRIDPATGDGIPGNPFYDPANPRAARSRVWALGLRNPCRMTLRPDTGSHLRSDANPGVLYIGDVGYGTWEDLNVCTGPGQNFGWPAFEGIEVHSGYYNANVANLDAPNPLYPASGCSQYFYFHDLIKQNTSVAANKPPFNNPCNSAQKIPGSIPQFLQTPPGVDWKHGTTLARTWIYNGSGLATAINVGAAGSPVSGSMFPGNCSIGGVWYTGSDFPAQYKNTYFHADFGANWIKSFVFDANNKPVSVADFLTGGGGIVAVATHPIDGGLYYITWSTTVQKISYSSNGNLPPTAVASANRNYGPGPLTVQFTGSGSTDPEGLPLTYNWNFGDGTPNSTAANPSHTFNAPAGVPTPYTVTLKVTDNAGQTSTATLLISLNNTPPTVTITSPVNGSKYPMTGNTVYDLRATVTDAESSDSQLKYEWQTILHHNNHEHQEPVDNNHLTTTVISPVGCDGNTYYYRIVLKVTDPAGLSALAEADLFPNCPNQPPVASFSANPTTGYTPLTVSFDGRSSTDPDGDALTLAWDFGDATGGTGLTPTHTYASVGNYNVVLTVTDSTGRSSTATTTISVIPVPPPGLDGTYFDNMDLTNPMLTRNDSTINFDWGTGSPDPAIGPDTFSVRWVGKIEPLYSETYTFYALTDDGFRLWVNNQLIIDSWIDQPPTEQAGAPIALTAGTRYDIRIEYYENGGGAVAKLLWSSPSQAKEIVAAGRLFPPAPAPAPSAAKVDPATSWNNPAPLVYGTPLSGTQLKATANVPGTFAYAPPAGTVMKAGNGQKLVATFTPSDTAHYNAATASAVIDVSKAPLTIKTDNKNRPYGQSNPPLTATYTGFVNGDTAASLDSPVVLSTTANASSPAGSYPITATGAADANYTISFVNGTLTVTSAFKAFVNFQPASSPVPAGYLVDSGQVYGNRGNGFTYGWDTSNTSFTRDRNSSLSADQRYDTLNHMQKAGGARVWEIAVPNGTYNVFLVSGDPNYYDSVFGINVEGVLTVSGTPTSSTHWFSGTKTVTVSDGRLSVSNATGGSNNKICFIEITGVSGVSPAAATMASVETAPKLALIGRENGGPVRLQIQGTAGRSYVLEVSDDLVHWTALSTLENTTGTLGYLDTASSLQAQRYYRAVLLPVGSGESGGLLKE